MAKTTSVSSAAVTMTMVTTTPRTIGMKVDPLSTSTEVSVVVHMLLGVMIVTVVVVGCSGLASSGSVGVVSVLGVVGTIPSGITGSTILFDGSASVVSVVGGWV